MAQLFETEPVVDIVAYAQVALEQGIDLSPDGLTYGVPAALGDLEPGQRVTVPLGRSNKPASGYVMSIADECALPPAKLEKVKPILSRDAGGVSLTVDLLRLAQWMAGYYCCPLGMVLVTMLPAAVKHGTGRVSKTLVGLPPVSGRSKIAAAGRESRGGDPDDNAGSDTSPSEERDAANEALDAHHPPPTPPSREASSESDAESTSESAPEPPADVKLTKLQRAVLDRAERLAAHGQIWTDLKELADLAGAKTVSPVKQLIEKGVLISKQQSSVRAAQRLFEVGAVDPGLLHRHVLTTEQDRALSHLAGKVHRGFSVNLLHGVTGSGKTEVYLRVIERLLSPQSAARGSRSEEHEGTRDDGVTIDDAASAEPSPEAASGGHFADQQASIVNRQASANRQSAIGDRQSSSALVLVPEIALTPQTVARFHERFGDQVAVLHSGLTPAQRHEQWRRIRNGKVRIVVGARSAVFAPLDDLGVIIVDEEHESSYKQDQLPRYHARDVAIKRAQLLGIPVVLGSATPSLESYHNATTRGTYHYLELPTRVAGLKLPQVEIVDLIAERRKRYEYSGKAGVHLLSLRLEAAIRQTLDQRAQTLLLLNRRGYANYIACPDHRCGWMMNCEFCDATMVYHKSGALPAGGYVECHHCTAKQMLPATCPTCSRKITVFGLGTQRVEEELDRKFPGIRQTRMDSDSMRTARDYYETLDRFRKGEIDILLGTQMIAKGLDFPNVRLVGVISGDTSLHMPDFRAAERTFQLIAQVAGRTGRGAEPGRVIVQSFNPDDPAITLAAKHDYASFAERELKVRREFGLPPITRMARIVCRDKDHVAAVQQARTLFEHLKRFNTQLGLNVRLRGPSPCPISRIAEFYRVQIEMIGPDAASIQKLMTALRNERLLKSDNHTAVDVDPVAMM